jgi:L,D-peptidoglycan transpeptidase YkuD (ErfK/YbiS/YcfS/YnhG family)
VPHGRRWNGGRDVAGSKARRVARALRLLAALAAAAVLLGVGAPVMARSVDAADVRSSTGLTADGLAALASAAAADTTVPEVHPAVPRGYSVPVPVAPPPAPAAAPATAARPTTTPARTTPAPAAAPTEAPPAATGARLPLPVPVGSSTQVVTVVAASSRSTTATVTAWQLGAGGWTAVVGPVAARIGAQGVGTASEDTSRTPAGTFTLSEGFGRAGNPGTALPYRVIDTADWWVSDRTSALYNQHARCAPGTCPFSEAAGEHLVDAGSSYNYAVVIDYNRRPAVAGKGSAFFLHVTNGAATAGCVAVPQSSLVAIMKWLDPAARPLISIGVG